VTKEQKENKESLTLGRTTNVCRGANAPAIVMLANTATAPTTPLATMLMCGAFKQSL
jgi:hypothetical protein